MTLAFLELIQRLGGEVRVPVSALARWPKGQALVVEDDPVTGDRVFRLARADIEAKVARLLQALT